MLIWEDPINGRHKEDTDMSDKQDQHAQEQVEAREEMRRFEEQDELPSDLSKWPDGKAKNLTFAASEDVPYGEGLTAKLGPELTRHADGSVVVDGKKVDNPEDFKAEPIQSPIEKISAERGTTEQ